MKLPMELPDLRFRTYGPHWWHESPVKFESREYENRIRNRLAERAWRARFEREPLNDAEPRLT